MTLFHFLREEALGLLDFLLPPSCPFCGRTIQQSIRLRLCPSCLESIPALSPAHCPRCALPYPSPDTGSHLCGACLAHPPYFEKVFALGCYNDLLRQVITRFKYHNEFSLDHPLGLLLSQKVQTASAANQFDLVVPVPLHRQRLRKRMYNQSLLLARVLGKELRLPVNFRLLIRHRADKPQRGLSATDRKQNLRGAFTASHSLSNQRILLVDDVMTTGSTANECAQTLLQAGAEKVYVAILARAPLAGLF